MMIIVELIEIIELVKQKGSNMNVIIKEYSPQIKLSKLVKKNIFPLKLNTVLHKDPKSY